MENQLISIDSRFRDKNAFKSASKFTYRLEEPLRNIDYVRLSSIELPNIHYTFTNAKGNTSFTIYIDDMQHDITILEGSYNSDIFLNYIHEQFNRINALYNHSFAITFNEITSKITLRNTTPFKLEFGVSEPGKYARLGYHMGFRQSTYDGANVYTGESVLDVIGDQYVYLRVNDYGVLYNRVATKRVLAKIILDKNKTFIIYDNEASMMSKNYRFRQPINIDRLEIEVLDPYGNNIDMLGQDFSFTLEIGCVQHAVLKERLEGRFNA